MFPWYPLSLARITNKYAAHNRLFLFLYFSNRESLDWKVPKERLVLLVLKVHPESPVLKA